MFDSASVLHKEITKQLVNPWIFSGSLINTDIQDHIPKKLYTFICWVIQGPASSLQTSSCEMSVHQNVMTITQNILYAFKSECQVQYKPKNEESLFCHRYEWPQLLAVAIAVHKATRSKKLIQFLHGFALSVDYSHILRIETKLASYVLDKIALEGAYVPPCIGKGRFIFFAIDNSDFNEDTLDGKRTCMLLQLLSFSKKRKS